MGSILIVRTGSGSKRVYRIINCSIGRLGNFSEDKGRFMTLPDRVWQTGYFRVILQYKTGLPNAHLILHFSELNLRKRTLIEWVTLIVFDKIKGKRVSAVRKPGPPLHEDGLKSVFGKIYRCGNMVQKQLV